MDSPVLSGIVATRWRTRWLLFGALLLAMGSCDQLLEPDPEPTVEPAPLSPTQGVSAAQEAVRDRYVVVLEPDVADPAALARDLVPPAGGRVHHVYEHALRGFSMTLPAQALDGIRRNPAVRYVAEDAMAYPSDVPVQAGPPITQSDPPWGLDRVDQRDLPLDATYEYTATGAGVTAYIIDSGIRPTHEEFEGRASIGIDLSDGLGDGIDCAGHGTHVAGTVGGATYGVAKDVELVAVRVFGCEGGAPFSVIIAAVDWVTGNATLPAVVNMSLSGSSYEPLDEAIRASVQAGLVYSVAAGNQFGYDACLLSPAGAPEAITVAASTPADARAEFSNIGACVDVFAPGVDIPSAWFTGDTDSSLGSGTSMAAPHVAGVVALYLETHPAATPAMAANVVMGTATAGRLSDIGADSPDRLLYSILTAAESGGVLAFQPRALRFDLFAPGEPGGVTGASDVVLLSNLGDTPIDWAVSSDAAWLTAAPLSGSLGAYDGTEIEVSVDLTGLEPGTYEGTLTAEAAGALNSPLTLDVTLAVLNVVALESGVPVTDLSGEALSESYFHLAVPEGATAVSFETFGGTGDVTLYVRYGDLPIPGMASDCISGYQGTNEECLMIYPPPGDWYILVRGRTEYEGVTLLGRIGEGGPVIETRAGTLFFERLLDPDTGEPVPLPMAATAPDRRVLDEGYELPSGRHYPAPSDGVRPASASPWLPLWLGNPGEAPLFWTAIADQPWLAVEPGSGVLEPWEGVDLAALVDAAGLAIGVYEGSIALEDPAAFNSPQAVPVRLSVQQLNVLELAVPSGELAGATGTSQYFRVTVPDGLAVLDVTTTGGTGDADLLVRYGAPPDLAWRTYDCGSGRGGNEERCSLPAPQPGDWYIQVFGWRDYSGVTLLAEEGEAAPVIDLWPPNLHFDLFVEPGTGAVVAPEPAPGSARPDRGAAEAPRSYDGKSYPADGAVLPTVASSQPIWLGNAGTGPLNWTGSTSQPWLSLSPASGTLDPWAGTELEVTADPAALPLGDHSARIEVADPAATNSPQFVDVTATVRTLEILELGTPLFGLSGAEGSSRMFRVTVPEGLALLEVETSGGTGDADLFVRYGSPPDLWTGIFDCVSASWSNEEECRIPQPAAGDWYIMIHGYLAYDGLTLLVQEGQPEPWIEVWPDYLFFYQLRDPETGQVIAGSDAPLLDRTRLEQPRTAGGQKQYPAPGDVDAGARASAATAPAEGLLPATTAGSQFVWLANFGTGLLNWTATGDQPWLSASPESGSLKPGLETRLEIAVDGSTQPLGWQFGIIEVADPAAPNSPRIVWVELFVGVLMPLSLEIPLHDQGGDWAGDLPFYRVTLPEHMKELEIRTSGGTGDVDLFVRHGAPPDIWTWEYDCLSGGWTNDESCVIGSPAGGEWYVLLLPYEPFEGVTLLASAVWTLEALVARIDALESDGDLSTGRARSLRSKLEGAIAARDGGDLATAGRLLQAFRRQLEGLMRTGELDREVATELLTGVASVLAELGG